MSDPVIEISNLSKKYRIDHYGKNKQNTIWDAVSSTLKHPGSLFNGDRADHEAFWALKGVDLNINKGDVLGIIGRNGSGKSTMLKILSQIVEPTTGTIRMKGRVASLLEVGTGFHPELTGRENIFFNGSILGMSRKEINAKFNDIVEFSEVEKFLDTPVKFYSSGMYVRLAFAVAAHLDPDILIVDEVLAVGDASFQKKSLGKMKDVAGQGRTVIFVSHSMESVMGLCNKALLLENGKMIKYGATKNVVSTYFDRINPDKGDLAKRTDRQGSGRIKLTDIKLDNRVDKNRKIEITLVIKSNENKTLENCKLSLDMVDENSVGIANMLNYTVGQKIDIAPGVNKVKVIVENFSLVPGKYSINCFLASDIDNKEIYDWIEGAEVFTVLDYDYYGVGDYPSFKGRTLYMDYRYETK